MDKAGESPSSSSLSTTNSKENQQTKDNVNSNIDEDTSISSLSWIYLEWDTVLPVTENGATPDSKALRKYTNPYEWSAPHKYVLVWISTVATAFTAYAGGCFTPAITQMSAEWHVSSVAALVGLTTFTVGFGVAPMILAPMSEINGRRPLFIVTGVIYLICTICTGVSHLYVGMLLARFFAGCACSTFSTMVGGVLADIFEAKDRNVPMAIYTGGVFFGTGLGPLIAGFIAQNTTWRWIFYSHAIVIAVLVVVIFFYFDESRGSVVLSKRAKAINKWYEEQEAKDNFAKPLSESDAEKGHSRPQYRFKVKADEERASIHKMIMISLYRPFHLLITEPVVFSFSLWVSFAWAVLFMTFAAIPYSFQTTYGFNLQQADAVFASISIAAVLFTLIAIYQEKWAAKKGLLKNAPEQRLQFACFESMGVPIGLFWFGWAANYSSVHWIVPCLGIGVATMGIFSVYLATFNYLADAYVIYASSAIAAQSFCRNMLGGAFPLFTQSMFRKLGIGPAASLLGGIGLVLTTVPWVLVLFGPQIRARSKIASAFLEKSG